LLQAAPLLCHAPLELQIWGCCELHRTALGTHDPWHAPLTHAELLHATAEPQLPFDWHVCTPLPEHCVAPGVHDPVHAPLTHAELLHATAEPH
jgi:hypothetical protein